MKLKTFHSRMCRDLCCDHEPPSCSLGSDLRRLGRLFTGRAVFSVRLSVAVTKTPLQSDSVTVPAVTSPQDDTRLAAILLQPTAL